MRSKYKIVLFGHKLVPPIHTHSWIHAAFYKTFQHLGYETLWLDNNDDLSKIDFNHSFFITEGQVDANIPLRDDCFYLIHNCDGKYKDLFTKNRCMNLQVYTDDVLKYNVPKLSKCIHADYTGKCLYMPWATDLLPHEIDANKPNIPFNKNSNIISWVGSVGGGEFGNINEIDAFKLACQENGIHFEHSSNNSKSFQDNVQLIKNSYLAPTLVGTWQQKQGYIPCRIFKNISYGQMGLTNSPRVFDLFDEKIIYNHNSHDLFNDAKKYIENMKVEELHTLMDFVKENHTYVNRINTIFDVFSVINPLICE
jgi:hypothetical protein